MSEISGAFQIQFSLNLFAVVFDCFDAQMEFLGDFLGLLPTANELKHFEFAIAEGFDRRLVDVGLTHDLLLEHFCAERVAHINGSAQDAANCDQNFFESFLLHQVAKSAGAEGDFGMDQFVMGAHNQDRQIGKLGFDISGQFQPAAGFERNVRDDELGFEFGNGA